MVSVFVGTSLDGFIARSNGSFDFLPAGGGEPHGYDEFIATVDALVIGRNTFETVLSLPKWPYGKKRVVVLSSRPLDFSAVGEGIVEQMAGSPAEIVAKLAAGDSTVAITNANASDGIDIWISTSRMMMASTARPK